MKKEIPAGEHCPYCKRHCSLKSPHCGKGKALAEKKLKEKQPPKAPGLKEPREVKLEAEEWKNLQSEIRLVRLFQKGCKQMSEKKMGKQEGKAARLYLLAALAEKDRQTQKELKEDSGLDTRELEKALQKLEKKGYVGRKTGMGSDEMVCITGKGLEFSKEELRDWKRENDRIFSRLTDKEKGFLEQILNKVIM